MDPVHTKYTEAETYEFPDAITLKILLTGADTGGAQAIFEDIVQPGVGPPRHIHHDQDETFFFLEGEFDVEVAGALYHMRRGDVAFIPRGTVHAFKNVGSAPGLLRYVFSPALKIEQMFRDFHAALGQGEFGGAEMAAIAETYGQTIEGPPL